jgi:hypothetical protein
MAAVELARGHNITVQPVPPEINDFLLAKEFHWLPDEIDRQNTKRLKGIMHVLSTFNKIRNQEIEKASKKSQKKR